MWFVFALLTFSSWGVADLFYKRGAVEKEKASHLKTSIVVGAVMGVTAVVTLFAKWIVFNPINILIYFPVSAMYILSMTIGYFGLKYLEVSVSSPIQNASGALTAVMLMLVFREIPDTLSVVSICLISAGVFLLGVFERKKEVLYQKETDKKYKIGFAAFMMPILYCVFDALGTTLDGIYLDIERTPLKNVTEANLEDTALISYELTFAIVAMILAVVLFEIKGMKLEIFSKEKSKMNSAPLSRLLAALFETGGQFAYVYAMSGNGIVAAPVIASYCVLSLVLGGIVLRERLSWKQYVSVALVVSGIVILGVAEALGGGE